MIFIWEVFEGDKFYKDNESENQLCPILCDLMECTIHGILQARKLELVVFSFFRGSPQPRDGSQVSHIAGGFFTN